MSFIYKKKRLQKIIRSKEGLSTRTVTCLFKWEDLKVVVKSLSEGLNLTCGICIRFPYRSAKLFIDERLISLFKWLHNAHYSF